MTIAALSVACLGAGYFSRFHHEAWVRNPDTQLVACADHEIEKAKDTPADNAYRSLDDMLSNNEVNILDIATPSHTHLDAIANAVIYPLTAIICQKPFCRSVEEAEQAIALAADANIPLIIHENFRFQPWFRCMKEAKDRNDIGDVLQYTFRLRTGDGQGEDAYRDRQPYFREMPRLMIYETGVHWLDTTQYMLGKADTVYADLRTLNPAIVGEDAGYVLLGYRNGKRALFDGNRLSDHCATNTRLTFGEASLEGTTGEINLKGTGEVTLRRFGETNSCTLLKAQRWQGFAGDCVYALQAHISSALLNGTTVENRAEEYLHIMKLVDLVYQSAKNGEKLKV